MLLSQILLLLCAFCLISVYSDQFVYVDTNAEDIVNDNLSQTPIPTVHLSLITSNTYHAGSVDQIQLTFIGEFSVSGPHLVGPFSVGSKDTITVTLDRIIGQLQKVIMHKDGVDSYLLSEMECRIDNQVYVMKGPRMWLDNVDPSTEATYPESDGYEPLAQEDMKVLAAATSVTFDVENVFYYYLETGMFTA